MRTKGLLVSIGVVTFSMVLFSKAQKEKQIRDLVFENIEALSMDEPVSGTGGNKVYFYWNNQHWEGEKDGSTGTWFPEYRWCDYMGSSGHQVACVAGSGNCWNGTNCKKD